MKNKRSLGERINIFDNIPKQNVEWFNYFFSNARLDAPLSTPVEILALVTSTKRIIKLGDRFMTHEFSPLTLTSGDDNENNMGDIYCEGIDGDDTDDSSGVQVSILSLEEYIE